MAAARGLGKGLDALIPSGMNEKSVSNKEKEKKNASSEKTGGETLVNITKVEPNREQPRKNFDEDALEELADSIKQFGLLQPILVQDRKIMKLLPEKEDGVLLKKQVLRKFLLSLKI